VAERDVGSGFLGVIEKEMGSERAVINPKNEKMRVRRAEMKEQ
jgi:hypothetical protein